MEAVEVRKKTVAFVLYPDLTVFDLAGPLQVFTTLAKLAPEFEPVVVAERMAPIDTDIPLKVMPKATFADIPKPFALMVPGGGVPTLHALSNQPLRAYVRSTAETAELVGSVCTGAVLLAAVGLLTGRQATTHWAYRQLLESFGAHYVRKRWVEDGKFVMSAGVSAGIDSGLYLAMKLTDEATARQVQLELQYDPQPPFGGINYDQLDLLPRMVRGGLTVAAPFITARPKRLTRLGR